MSKTDPAFLRLVFDEEEVYKIDAVNEANTGSSAAETAPASAENNRKESPAAVEEPAADYATSKPAILGNPSSAILILLHAPEHDFIEPGDHGFLQDILKAIKLSLDEVAVVNTARIKDEHITYLQEDSFDKVILFGEDKSGGRLITHPQNPYIIGKHEGRKTLKAEELQLIRSDRNKKVNLWNALKELFL